MRTSESCAKCLFDRQKNRTADQDYLKTVKRILDARSDSDTSPLLVFRFNQEYEKRFGKTNGYAEVKKHYNDLMTGIEDTLRIRISSSDDPLKTALALSRSGNYIDYGAMDHVDEDTCLNLIENASFTEADEAVYGHFLESCARAKSFMLIADNCGEIVLDKLFLEQLHRRFPRLQLQVLVRGEEVLNDVTPQDARYVHIDKIARILSNGTSVAGTVIETLPEDVRAAFDETDVILAKGQGNYESLSGHGRHIFYAFLCKCDLFTRRFHVPPLTGMLVEESGLSRD